MKSGAPSKDVRTPIGISSGLYSALDNTSDHIMTILPIRALKSNVFLCLGPPTILARCGIMRPIKPTTPTFDTNVAMTMDDIITMLSCNCLTDKPICAAS